MIIDCHKQPDFLEVKRLEQENLKLVLKLKDAILTERKRCAKIAEEIEHPNTADWNWNRPKTKREQFYKNHIVHAWKQAGVRIAAKIMEKQNE